MVFIANLANTTALISIFSGLDRGATIGGELTEVVSAPNSALKESSLLQSVSAASTVDINTGGNLDTDLESALYDERDLLITGEDSILQNQNPITVPAPTPTSESII
ncbi:MAG: hypothetical protein NT078_00735 [Candidatus Azambacteria bacterium]|nr:hypothetical protein [Candidatus Azambacteria bacterium]